VGFYFPGHGSQVPDTKGDEGGGHDEILLPADASGWKGAFGAVDNAVVDDELADWARPLMAQGVQVAGRLGGAAFDGAGRAGGGAFRWRGL